MSRSTALFWAGGLASFVFWGVSIPADNLKNSMMGFPLTSRHPPALRHIASQVYTREGILGFYRGFVPIILRAFPVNACAYLVYESLMGSFGAEKVR